MSSEAFVTRFAPSPTGALHLGNARTAFLSYLAARKTGGRFILRIEDTDEQRHQESQLDPLLKDLRWLGLEWDEGPEVGGPHGPYRQSERSAFYDARLADLEARHLTYPCFCTTTELALERKRQLASGKPPRYSGKCRALTPAQVAEKYSQGLQAAIRFHVPNGQVVQFDDFVHGAQRFNTDDIGDFIIRRADGSAAFFFSNALDDAAMGITLVLRGDDHLTNTPRQMLILEAFSLPAPRYAHVALLLGMDGAPLSKRHGSTSLHEFRERGFLPQALRNHLVRLGHTVAHDGWLDDAQMIADFDLGRLGRAAAKFDEIQLRHWQKEAVARLPFDQLMQMFAQGLPATIDNADASRHFFEAIRPNIEFPADVGPWADVVFGDLPEASPDVNQVMREAGADFFAAAAAAYDKTGADLKTLVRELSQATGRKGPAIYMPLRAALTAQTHGPELGPLLKLIPPAKVTARFDAARRLAA